MDVETKSLSENEHQRRKLKETFSAIHREVYNTINEVIATANNSTSASLEFHSSFLLLVDSLDVYTVKLSEVINFMKINSLLTTEDLTRISNLELHFVGTLKAILHAKEINDFSMMNDLLEFEIKDNLTQWYLFITFKA